MPISTTLTVRLPENVKRRLGKLALSTNRTKSFLAGEAISGYVDRELEIIEGIKRGLTAMDEGRVVTSKAVRHRVDATIRAAQAKRR
jgi:predicted transcriptional regulator